VGSALSLFSGRSAWWGGLRMLLIGAGAGLVSYCIGTLVGRVIGG
jgi:VIT1/CCC1 family predicted Fe2+/Mn2+ transporter